MHKHLEIGYLAHWFILHFCWKREIQSSSLRCIVDGQCPHLTKEHYCDHPIWRHVRFTVLGEKDGGN